jgi:aminoglycoside phosphotransferase (APT) family kinase protein
MSGAGNRTIEVREEDSFDVPALAKWLQKVGIQLVGEMTVRQFKGGASNLTYLISDSAGNKFVLRTPPHGAKAASAHDMSREARVLTALSPSLSLAPKVLGFCDDHDVIGRDFYVMEYIDGNILSSEIPESLCPTPESVRALCESMVDSFAALHLVDIGAAGLTDLDKGPGYVARQVGGWSKRYRAARTPDVPDAESIMNWLDTNQPPDVSHCLIHGDWRFDNLVVDDNAEIIGILDWEMSTIGDPCMDLGAALAYWIQQDDAPDFTSFKLQPTDTPGMLNRAEVIARYGTSMPQEVRDSLESNLSFYEVYGLFRLAVIIQQIWARFCSGATTNPQFAGFGSAVNMLIQRAQDRIDATFVVGPAEY